MLYCQTNLQITNHDKTNCKARHLYNHIHTCILTYKHASYIYKSLNHTFAANNFHFYFPLAFSLLAVTTGCLHKLHHLAQYTFSQLTVWIRNIPSHAKFIWLALLSEEEHQDTNQHSYTWLYCSVINWQNNNLTVHGHPKLRPE